MKTDEYYFPILKDLVVNEVGDTGYGEWINFIEEEKMSLKKKDEEDWEKGRKEWLKACKKKGFEPRLTDEELAFEIFDIFNNEKVNVRKIYIDGHIEGFEGNPLVVNHIFPKMQALKYLAQSINKEYRDLIRRFILSDYHPMNVVDDLYKRNKETIEKI